MLQLLQHLGNGTTSLLEVPAPGPRRDAILVESRVSVVSAGTERMLVEFGRSSLFGKVRQQPERVREVWAKLQANGLGPTLEAIRSKLSQSIPLGYCNVGVVRHSGSPDFAQGDRIVSNGPHAEVISVSPVLAARIPAAVDDTSAGFVPLAAVALQGINLLSLKHGDKVVVTGLGLIGQLAVRILIARGHEVMGLDPSAERRAMAAKHGAFVSESDDPVYTVLAWTGGRGVAGVLITASTSSSTLISQAARSCAKRGRVVLVGVVGLDLKRSDFYQNEVSFQVSCSYGERDHIGPGSVRANFTEVLGYMASGSLKIGDLVTQRFKFGMATAAYDRLTRDHSALGLVLDYAGNTSLATELPARLSLSASSVFTLVGAGNYAVRTLLPKLASMGARPALIISNQGYQAILASQLFGPSATSTVESSAFTRTAPPILFVCTRHDSHAHHVVSALRADKSVWVEKPLAIKIEDLHEVEKVATKSDGMLMVGFNRRFAPAASKIREALASRPEPKIINITINAGRLEPDHWALNPELGGGRIVGEACHFVDLSRSLIGYPVSSIKCHRRDTDGQDGGCFELTFSDGSTSTIDYRTDLPPELPKEKIVISGKSWSATIHNWTRLDSVGLDISLGWCWSRAPDKGHLQALHEFIKASQGKAPPPIPLDQLLEVSKVSIWMQQLTSKADSKDNLNLQ